MPNFNDVLKNDVTRGIAIGAGIVAAGWLLAPALRPAARAALKSGLLLIERGREKMAEASEALEDLMAEVQAELSEERIQREQAAEAGIDTQTGLAADGLDD